MGTRGPAWACWLVLALFNQPDGITALSQVPILSTHGSPLSGMWDHSSDASVSKWEYPSRVGLQSHPEYRLAADGLANLGTARTCTRLARLARDTNRVPVGALGRPRLLGCQEPSVHAL